jgi:hypothetical protein
VRNLGSIPGTAKKKAISNDLVSGNREVAVLY